MINKMLPQNKAVDEDENYYVCENCFLHPDIRIYIKEKGINHSCCLCHKEALCVNAIEDEGIRTIFSFLIRHYYSCLEYDNHGLYQFTDLLSRDNPIISIPDGCDTDVVERLTDDQPIALFFDPPISWPLKELGSKRWKNILSDLELQNYDDVESKYLNQLEALIQKNLTSEYSNGYWFRARIGNEEKRMTQGEYEFSIKSPFWGKDISAPPPSKTVECRANRIGISHLYLATSIDTALAEVRPAPGHYVSIGTFKVDENLRILNLCHTNILDYVSPKSDYDDYVLYDIFRSEFETPLTPDKSNRYYKSQFITDIAKKCGADGLMFNSSVSTGINLVLFNTSNAIYQSHKEMLVKIKKQSYRYGFVSYEKDNLRETYEEVVKEKINPPSKSGKT
ncbi:RES family NAD+ phosphorylase [Fibrobacter sp.]|uniref:RES family NAD+ phosphorylase n=1 Tax=Fibrobacter sp. TaxID=35828 RepID=UPI0038678E7A